MKLIAPSLILVLTICTNAHASEETFLATVDSFYSAVNSGDQAAHADLFTDNAYMLADNWHISRGQELKSSIQQTLMSMVGRFQQI